MSYEFERARLDELKGYTKSQIIEMYARTLNHLRAAIANHNLWKCPRCGHYGMPGNVCPECGRDQDGDF